MSGPHLHNLTAVIFQWQAQGLWVRTDIKPVAERKLRNNILISCLIRTSFVHFIIFPSAEECQERQIQTRRCFFTLQLVDPWQKPSGENSIFKQSYAFSHDAVDKRSFILGVFRYVLFHYSFTSRSSLATSHIVRLHDSRGQASVTHVHWRPPMMMSDYFFYLLFF